MEQYDEITPERLEKMISDYINYWDNPQGKSDIEAKDANVLQKNALRIAQQLLKLLRKNS